MSPLGGEKAGVQNPILRYARDAGWSYLPPPEAERLRRGEGGVLFHEVAVDQLQRLNPGVVDHLRAEELVKAIAGVRPTIEGNQAVWDFLCGRRTVFVQAEKRERNVQVLDRDKVERNTFHVTEEYRFFNGRYRIRPDVVFLVNGLPVLIVEAKAASHLEGISEALDQMQRYHREGPKLLALAQLYGLTHAIQLYYGATWSLSAKLLFNWRDEHDGNFEAQVKSFVDHRRLLEAITEFILFTRKTAELVSEYTASGGIAPPEEPVQITPEALAAIAAGEEPEVVRVVNLVKALHRAATEQATAAPYLISIGERAEEIAQRFYDRQMTTLEALEALQHLVEQYRDAERERLDTDLTVEGFTVYQALKLDDVTGALDTARAVEPAFADHPHWRHSDKQEQQVRLGLYRILLPQELPNVVAVVDRILDVLRRV